MIEPQLTTAQKALKLNRDASKYGTFAEIGAGQEVARWFFHVGGAAGTVAKTMSAYDMSVSDAIYGPSDRYVSRQRLGQMLDYEYGLLLERLEQQRGGQCQFFVFADTVATRSYSRQEDGQGWMGVRFQHRCGARPSEILIHVRLHDIEHIRQQEAVGILGVNLLYGAFELHQNPVALIGSLLDDLIRERVEINMIKFSGECFKGVDNRLMSLQLLEHGFTHAAMFTADGQVVQAGEVLYHKPVLIGRGSFRPVTNLTLDLIERSAARFKGELPEGAHEPAVIMEMTLRSITAQRRNDHSDFLARVDMLGALGKIVMISNFDFYHRVPAFLRRYTRERIGFALGVPALRELFNPRYYAGLPGGTLEALGALFNGDVRLFVYPARDAKSGRLITADTLEVAPEARHLYEHARANGLIESLEGVDERHLAVRPPDVLAQIRNGDRAWESHVPHRVVDIIKCRLSFREDRPRSTRRKSASAGKAR